MVEDGRGRNGRARGEWRRLRFPRAASSSLKSSLHDLIGAPNRTAVPISRAHLLAVPPVPCIVHASVFDAFGWHTSDTLEWLHLDRPADTVELPSSENPPGLAFVIRGDARAFPFLPWELCELHVPRIGLPLGSRMLAPWAIDDATDLLYETRTPPGNALFLATTSVAALFWGLHDWAHFHSHGPFEERAATELQCDVTALVWLRLNAAITGIDEATWERTREAAVGLTRARATQEGVTLDENKLSCEHLLALVDAL